MGRARVARNAFAREFKKFNGLIAFDGGELLEEIIERSATGEIIEERLGRDARTGETRDPTLDLRIDLNDRFCPPHDSIIAKGWFAHHARARDGGIMKEDATAVD